MVILHIIPNLGSGGAERFVVDLANYMAKSNKVYICTLFTLKEGENNFFFKEVDETVKVVSLNKNLGLDFKVFFALNNLIKELKPDVVHTHLGAINYILPSVLLNRNVLFLHTIHSDAFKEVKNKAELKIRGIFFKKKLICPITISDTSNESFNKAYGFIGAKTIFNGRKKQSLSKKYIDVKDEIEIIKKTPKTTVLINVGRLVQVKNQLMLTKVVNRLVLEGYDIILLIIGNDTSHESIVIKNKIKEVNSGEVYMIGPKSNILDYFYFADAFCLSSIYEGLPISLLEAMSMGCIPICTPIGGVNDIVKDGELGFLSKGVTEDEYYLALKRFLDRQNYALMQEMLIKEFDSKYEIKVVGDNYISYYEECFLNKTKIKNPSV